MRNPMRKGFQEVAMRRYYLHKRKNVFYAELVTPQGNKLTARSTGKTTEDEALLVVSKWLSEGIPSKEDKKEKPVETVIILDEILKSIRTLTTTRKYGGFRKPSIRFRGTLVLARKNRHLICEALVIPDAPDILLGAWVLEGMDLTINPKRELVGVHGDIVMHRV
jgi:hypothetical protein